MNSDSFIYKQTSSSDLQLELEVLEDMLLEEREGIQKGFEGIQFLIADGDRVLAGFIKKSLMAQFKKAVIVYAKNYKQVLEQLKRAAPDVLITDQQMPGRKGFNLIEILRSDGSTKKINILMLTEKRSDAKALPKVQGILVKPFTSNQLVEVIQQILSGSETTE